MDNDQKTEILIQEVMKEMERAKKKGTVLRLGATALIVSENPERVTPVNDALLPNFFVTKIHNGHVVFEMFV